MQLYQSEYLSIWKNQDTLIQEWSKKKLTPEIFKTEILNYLGFFISEKPKTFLWLNENFNLIIPKEIAKWLETDILNSEYVNGMRKIAIVVAKNNLAHITLVKVLNTSKTLLQPHYYTNRKDAEAFIESGHDTEDFNANTITYNIKTNSKNHQIDLSISHSDLPQAIDALETLKNNKSFAKAHEERFKKLTIKELEIFKLIVQGNTNKEIAEQLFIQTSTVATHRKHIVRKLETHSYIDLYRYAKAFKIVRF